MARQVAAQTFPDSISFRGCCMYLPSTVIPTPCTVFSNGQPTAKATDVLTPVPCTCICEGCGPPLTRQIIAVSTVFKDGRPTAHAGDLTAPVSPRTILPGFTTIFAS